MQSGSPVTFALRSDNHNHLLSEAKVSLRSEVPNVCDELRRSGKTSARETEFKQMFEIGKDGFKKFAPRRRLIFGSDGPSSPQCGRMWACLSGSPTLPQVG